MRSTAELDPWIDFKVLAIGCCPAEFPFVLRAQMHFLEKSIEGITDFKAAVCSFSVTGFAKMLSESQGCG